MCTCWDVEGDVGCWNRFGCDGGTMVMMMGNSGMKRVCVVERD